MMSRVVIAIAGQKRVGKDTVAEHLCLTHGFTNAKISAPLKRGIMQLFGFTRQQVEDDMKDVVDEFWGIEPRRVMQWLGTDIFQHRIQELFAPTHASVGRLFWMRQLERHLSEGITGHVVVSDVRFDHELQSLREWANAVGGVTLVTVRVDRALVAVDYPAHESEECQMITDRVMTNDGSVMDLRESVDRLMDDIRQGRDLISTPDK